MVFGRNVIRRLHSRSWRPLDSYLPPSQTRELLRKVAAQRTRENFGAAESKLTAGMDSKPELNCSPVVASRLRIWEKAGAINSAVCTEQEWLMTITREPDRWRTDRREGHGIRAPHAVSKTCAASEQQIACGLEWAARRIGAPFTNADTGWTRIPGMRNARGGLLTKRITIPRAVEVVMNFIAEFMGAIVVSGMVGAFLGWLIMRSAVRCQAKRLRMALPSAEQNVPERSHLPFLPHLHAVDARREP